MWVFYIFNIIVKNVYIHKMTKEMENVMYCKNCGMKLENGAKFCGRCGMPVDNEIFETGRNGDAGSNF